MAAAHFSTIPCEPYTAHKVQGKPYLCNICLCAINFVYARFEDARISLYVYMSIVKSFLALRIMDRYTNRHLFSYGRL